MRPPRPGEVTCHCFAYRFPHRFGGGHCRGRQIVLEAWARNWGAGPCSDCANLAHDERWGVLCEVEQGQESEVECPIWQEEVQSSGARLLGPYWKRKAQAGRL